MQHRASMASYRMTDLREEINQRRGGEDSHTTIELNRERHQDIEGATSRDTLTCMHQRVRAKLHMHLSPWLPGSFGGGGCMALAPHLCMVF
jgi:hypothetical protein